MKVENEFEQSAYDFVSEFMLDKLIEFRKSGLEGSVKDMAVLQAFGDHIASIPAEQRGNHIKAILIIVGYNENPFLALKDTD